MAFPATRMRRLRRTGVLRGLIRETELTPQHLVQPLFVTAGSDVREQVAVDAGSRAPLDLRAGRGGRPRSRAAGVDAVLLFGIPADKDEVGSGAYDDEGVVQMAIRALKDADPDLVVITDICMCEYTSHGHCGVLRDDGTVDNDLSIELLAKTALTHAAAGADAVAPTDMMDGRIGSIRGQLDDEGFSEVPIIAYSAKYASAFYGPFRDAAGSTPQEGDRRGYQMDPANVARGDPRGAARSRGGRRHAHGQAGASLPRRDPPGQGRHRRAPSPPTMSRASTRCSRPPPQNGWLDERAAVLESLTSIRRAGADVIITYYAKEAADAG